MSRPGRSSAVPIGLATLLAAALCALAPTVLRAQEESDQLAMRRCQRMLKEKPFAQIEDSLVRIAVNEIIPRNRWRAQDLYLLGVTIGEKAPDCFLGPFLRGLYFSAVSSDRRGHERARLELAEAWTAWPRARYAAERGSLDAMIARMVRDGVPFAEQLYRYNLTHSYLQLNYQLSQEHLELNEAREAYGTIRALMEEDFAFDFYSLNKLSWMYYKYRYFAPGPDTPFLKPTFTGNIDAALSSAFAAQRKIAAYLAAKPSHTRYWQDESSIGWYADATTNLISIAYGVRWQTDSAIVYYEKMPEYMKLRNNGQIIYLSGLNYRAAEYQFEMVGMAEGSR
ncbi:MAG: hypothetical protein IPP94_02655 [Ignavibacteria bacterium]|nr:hypothetical protein [Ignavibacteria bacterium]